MADIFESTQNSVKEFSNELIASLRASLKEVVSDLRKIDTASLREIDTPSKRNKTLAIIGVGAILVGGIGLICEAAWAKWLLLAGGGSVGVDYFVLRPNASNHKSNASSDSIQEENIPMSMRYNVVKKLTVISDKICSRWDVHLNEVKDSLLEYVGNSDISDDRKVKVNYNLYVVNKISYSLDNWIPRFEGASNSKLMKETISEYGVYLTGQIEEACKKQIISYKKAESNIG